MPRIESDPPKTISSILPSVLSSKTVGPVNGRATKLMPNLTPFLSLRMPSGVRKAPAKATVEDIGIHVNNTILQTKESKSSFAMSFIHYLTA